MVKSLLKIKIGKMNSIMKSTNDLVDNTVRKYLQTTKDVESIANQIQSFVAQNTISVEDVTMAAEHLYK